MAGYVVRGFLTTFKASSTRQGKPKSLVAKAAIASLLSPETAGPEWPEGNKRCHAGEDRVVYPLLVGRALRHMPRARSVMIVRQSSRADPSPVDRPYFKEVSIDAASFARTKDEISLN